MSDPYATHIPVLEALTGRLKPSCVVEYGGGHFSTPFFLSVPSVELLITVEDDEEWRKTLANEYRDRRLHIVEKLKLAGNSDLVLIDNGTAVEQRVEVIRDVLARPNPTVVIHDAEIPAYEQAIVESGKRFTVDKTLTPYTAVVSPCES